MTLLDLWEVPPAAADAEIAFDSTSAGEPAAAVWRLDLSGDPEAASQELQEHYASVQAMAGALDTMPERIEGILAQGKPVPAGVSFAPGAGVPSSAETSLLENLARIDLTGQAVSFAAGESPLAGWSAAYDQFQDSVRRLLRAVAHMAWVETRMEGRLLGRTAVGWSGDTDTIYKEEISPEQASLHRRSLEIAVASRNIMIRAVAASFAGAARLSVLLAAPGGALLALPAIWQYVTQILAQVEQYQRVKSPAVPGTSQ